MKRKTSAEFATMAINLIFWVHTLHLFHFSSSGEIDRIPKTKIIVDAFRRFVVVFQFMVEVQESFASAWVLSGRIDLCGDHGRVDMM